MSHLTCISPIDGSIYAERDTLNLIQAKQIVTQARTAQKKWITTPIKERINYVTRAISNLGSRNEQVVVDLAHMMGRPVRFGGEFGGVKERCDYLAKIAVEQLSEKVIEDSSQFLRKIVREPHGVVLVIAPWNYPFLTAINTIIPALISGNVVILKHATQTLLAGEHLEASFREAGIPSGVFQNIFIDHQTLGKLIATDQFDFINFTGSVTGGEAIEKAAAGTFTPITLELGGKDPGYVMEDANIPQAVETLIDGAIYNSGQCCCGIERIYVLEKHFDEFVDRAVKLTSRYVLGNPLNQDTTLGPMAHQRFANEVRSQIKEAVASGAMTHIDPNLFPLDNGHNTYVMPQILTQVDHTMRIMREETFGPVVGIMKVKNDDEAINLINDSSYGLTVSLWTNDPERANRLGAKLETGTVFMNRCDYLDPALCWTGCKATGKGGSLSELAFQYLTRPKSYHFRKTF